MKSHPSYFLFLSILFTFLCGFTPQADFLILGPNTNAMPDCVKAKSHTPAGVTIGTVIRVYIPDPLNPVDMTRQVYYKRISSASTTSDPVETQEDANDLDIFDDPPTGQLPDNPISQSSPYYTNPFHIDMTIPDVYDPNANGKYTMIRIILTNYENYTFYDEDKNHPYSASIHGVGWGGKTNDLLMCGSHIRSITTGLRDVRQVAVFYIPSRSSDKNVHDATFNIGLVVNPDGNDTTPNRFENTPIFIDPHAHQPG
jgi:hypothetical protein